MFNTKSSQIAKTFLWLLNSAMLSSSSEVTLVENRDAEWRQGWGRGPWFCSSLQSQQFFAVLFKQIFHLKSSKAKIRLKKSREREPHRNIRWPWCMWCYKWMRNQGSYKTLQIVFPVQSFFLQLKYLLEWPALWRITMNSLHNEGIYKWVN